MQMFLILSLCSCACWNGSSNQEQNKIKKETYIARHNLYDNSSIEELCSIYLGEADVDKQEVRAVDMQRYLTGYTSTESIPSSIADDILDMMQMSESNIKSSIPFLPSDAESCARYSDRVGSYPEATNCLKRKREERVQPMLIQHDNSIGLTADDYMVVSQAKTAISVYEPQNICQSGSLLQSKTLHPDQDQPLHLGLINSPYPSHAPYPQFETISPPHPEPIDSPTTEHSAGPKRDTRTNYGIDPEIQRIMQFMQEYKSSNKSFLSLLDTYMSKDAIPDEQQSTGVYQRCDGQKEQTCTQLNMGNTPVQNFSWNIYEHAHQVQDIMNARLQRFDRLCRWLNRLKMITRQKCFKSLLMMGSQVEALYKSCYELKNEIFIFQHLFFGFNHNITMFNAVMAFISGKMHEKMASDIDQQHGCVIATFESTAANLRIRVSIMTCSICLMEKTIGDRMRITSRDNAVTKVLKSASMSKLQQVEESTTTGGNVGINCKHEPSCYIEFFKTAYTLIHEVKRENVRLQEATNHLIVLLTYNDDPTT